MEGQVNKKKLRMRREREPHHQVQYMQHGLLSRGLDNLSYTWFKTIHFKEFAM